MDIAIPIDFWVIRDSNTDTSKLHPFCAVDAKLPNPHNRYTTDLSPAAIGQMFDHLCLLRKYFGVRVPFGFITTYFSWWICWLPDCDEVARTSTVIQANSSNILPEKRVLHGTTLDLPRAFDQDKATPRDRADVERFCRQIVSAVWKSVKCGRGEPDMSLPNRLTCYKPNGVTWERLHQKTTKIVDGMPKPTTTKFFELSFLGKGADGKARMVCDEYGHRCVMKQYLQTHSSTINLQELTLSNDHTKKELEMEAELWKVLNGVDTFIVTLNRRPALIMPYLHPLSETECLLPEIQDQVIALMESCAEKNYIQTDAAWRHVGWYKYEEQKRLMLLDFGRVEEMPVRSDAVARQQKINYAVSMFCVCGQSKEKKCRVCAYVKIHTHQKKRRRRR